jgi:hypothetical protein
MSSGELLVPDCLVSRKWKARVFSNTHLEEVALRHQVLGSGPGPWGLQVSSRKTLAWPPDLTLSM